MQIINAVHPTLDTRQLGPALCKSPCWVQNIQCIKSQSTYISKRVATQLMATWLNKDSTSAKDMLSTREEASLEP